jgi:hypothetical protein
MNMEIIWSRAIPLSDASKRGLIYGVDLDKTFDGAGVYIFGRQWGTQFEALYIGRSARVRSRIKNHLNNLHLMSYLRKAKIGRRILLVGKFAPRPGQQVPTCLPLIERALIRHFLSEGHDIANQHGTSIKRHSIDSSGPYPKRYIQKSIFLEKS